MKNFILHNSLVLLLFIGYHPSFGQANVGINTDNPVRSLEVKGINNEYVRIHSTNNFGGEAGIELLLGNDQSSMRDYKLTNDAGTFKIITSNDNFDSQGDELLRIDYLGQVGIGTSIPATRLHVDGGELASNTDDGFMVIGAKSGTNLVFDRKQIIARNNGASTSLQIQGHDGLTHIGTGGGHTYFGGPSGSLGIGTSTLTAKLNIQNAGFQMALRNEGTGVNEWYIGASNDTWQVGDNQLIFSPATNSGAAVLRLLDVTDNNGTVAPVMIQSSDSQCLLLDGNEIESKYGPLYINHNSDEYTFINPSGGRVGIGTEEPSTTVSIRTQDDEPALRLQKGSSIWDIDPNPTVDWLGFVKNGFVVGHVNGASGQWVTISDRRLKENIRDMEDVLHKLNQVNVYTYSFIQDSAERTQIGIIAQELQNLFPELVTESDEFLAVAYSKFSVLILKALQEQDKQIEILKNEMASLLKKEESLFSN